MDLHWLDRWFLSGTCTNEGLFSQVVQWKEISILTRFFSINHPEELGGQGEQAQATFMVYCVVSKSPPEGVKMSEARVLRTPYFDSEWVAKQFGVRDLESPDGTF